MSTRPRIRVLVVDDSPTMASALSALLREDPRLEVVAQAESGERAVALARLLRPDVITMDLLMPGLDGPAAIEAVMAEAPCRILVVSAVERAREVDLGMSAMAAGALEIIAKPKGGADALRAWGRQLATTVRLMSEIPVVTRRWVPRRMTPVPAAAPLARPLPVPPAALPAAPAPGLPAGPPRRAEVLALVASTGGPVALAQILAALPATLPAPVLVAQHMTPGFTAGMIRWFSGVTRLTVRIAQDGELLQARHVYFAPDGMDLTVDGLGRACVRRNVGGHCPSGDALLHSVAAAYGARAAGAVLTGMGEDGARGLLALRQAGGATLAQDESTSVVYGMPRVAHELGAALEVLPLPRIAARLSELCTAPRPPPPRPASGPPAS